MAEQPNRDQRVMVQMTAAELRRLDIVRKKYGGGLSRSQMLRAAWAEFLLREAKAS